MHRKIVTLGMVGLLFLSVLCACGTARTDRNAYPNDGYLGLSTSNPNLQTSRNYSNYRKDFQRAHQVLNQLQHVRDVRIILDGGVMRVRLKLNQELTEEQIGEVQQEAYRLLDFEFPRYSIIVTNNLNNLKIPIGRQKTS